MVKNSGINLHLRLAELRDMHNVFVLSNDDELRKNSMSQEKIKLENHIEWFQNKINSSNCYFYIIESSELFIGYLRFDKNLTEKNNWLVSIGLIPSMRGNGFGVKVLKLGLQKVDITEASAYVKTQNIASLISFLKADFSIKDLTEKNNEKYLIFTKTLV